MLRFPIQEFFGSFSVTREKENSFFKAKLENEDKYSFGEVHGFTMFDHFEFFEAWTPRKWHSFCILSNQVDIKLLIDNNLIQRNEPVHNLFNVNKDSHYII